MTDQNPIAPPGTTLTDDAAIAAALKEQAELTERIRLLQSQMLPNPVQMKFAGAVEEKDEKVPVEELKRVEEPKPNVPVRDMALPEARPGGAPPWALLPAGITFPRGRVAYFLRFRSDLTNQPKKGNVAPDNGLLYRQAIVWAMSVGDKKIAIGRSNGNILRLSDELTKSMVRAVDGQLVTGEDATLDIWWDEVGEKVRGLLDRMFSQIHNLKREELDHFLEHCIEARTAG